MSWNHNDEAPPALSDRKTPGRADGVYEKTRRRQPVVALGTVLNRVVSDLGLDRRVREKALMELWPQVAGERLSELSRPIFIDCEGNLVVSAAGGAVAQELSMNRKELLKRIGELSSSLGVPVKGLRFDIKSYYRKDDRPGCLPEPPLPADRPPDDELAVIKLSGEDFAGIASLATELSASAQVPVDLRRRILRLYELELKIRQWRRDRQYPLCQKCGEPSPRLMDLCQGTETRRLCPVCFWQAPEVRNI